MANLAVIKLAGVQHLVRPGDKFEVNRLENEVEKSFTPEVVLSTDGENLLMNSGKVELRVLEHTKGDKLYVIKFKAKSRYTRRTGHRQHLSLVEVVSVNGEAKEVKSARVEEKTEKEPAKAPKTSKPRTTKKATKKTEE